MAEEDGVGVGSTAVDLVGAGVTGTVGAGVAGLVGAGVMVGPVGAGVVMGPVGAGVGGTVGPAVNCAPTACVAVVSVRAGSNFRMRYRCRPNDDIKGLSEKTQEAKSSAFCHM